MRILLKLQTQWQHFPLPTMQARIVRFYFQFFIIKGKSTNISHLKLHLQLHLNQSYYRTTPSWPRIDTDSSRRVSFAVVPCVRSARRQHWYHRDRERSYNILQAQIVANTGACDIAR